MKNNGIEYLLFRTKGVVNFNSENYIEVQPGIMTPMIINIKSTLNDFNIRSKIVKELIKKINPKTICICGIESGGSYYASAIADVLEKPLVLFRKKTKQYGVGGRFVGTIPNVREGIVTVIDDVIAGGKISSEATKALIAEGYRVEVITIFSYLPKMKKVMSKTKIIYLSDIKNLCKIGKNLNFFTEKDVKLIKKNITKF